jgi:hypothetical protein
MARHNSPDTRMSRRIESACGMHDKRGGRIITAIMMNHRRKSGSRSLTGPTDRVLMTSGMKATPDQQLHFLIRDVLPVLRAVAAGYVYDPGSSDLDDEQTITCYMTLGDYRRASRLKWELEKAAE